MSAQPQTFQGLRGETRLSVVGDNGRPLTYNDAYLAVLVGLNRTAMRPDDADPYGADLNDVDPIAAAQNAACYLEEMAGIYPNVPPIAALSDTQRTDTEAP